MSSSSKDFTPLTGGCTCSHVRYKVLAKPLIVNCCHCHECQRLTGSAYAINYVVETSNIVLENQENKPIGVRTPSTSGKGQLIMRCPKCQVALWSYYGGMGPVVAFLRAGTVDLQLQDRALPDVHIFTKSKAPWVELSKDAQAYAEFYRLEDHWSEEALARREAMKPMVEAWKAKNPKFWFGVAEVMGEDETKDMTEGLGL